MISFRLMLLTLMLWALPAGAMDFRFMLDNSLSMKERIPEASGSAPRSIDKVNRLLAELLRDWPDAVGVSAVEWNMEYQPLEYYTPASLAAYLGTGYKRVFEGSRLGVALRDQQWRGCVHHMIVTNDMPADDKNFEYALRDALEGSSSVTVVLAPYKEPEQSAAYRWYQKRPQRENYFVVPLSGEDAIDLQRLREHVKQLSSLPGCNIMLM